MLVGNTRISTTSLKQDFNKLNSEFSKKFKTGERNLGKFSQIWASLDFGSITLLNIEYRRELVYGLYSISLLEPNSSYFIYGFYKASGSQFPPKLELSMYSKLIQESLHEPILLEFLKEASVIVAVSQDSRIVYEYTLHSLYEKLRDHQETRELLRDLETLKDLESQNEEVESNSNDSINSTKDLGKTSMGEMILYDFPFIPGL